MRYAVLSLVCAAAVIAYVQRMALSVPTKDIQADLRIDEGGMGLIMGCWFWGYALLQIPAGWVTDRIGSKRSLAVFVALWSALTGMAALAGGFYQLLFLWSLVGLAQTGLVPGAAKAIGTWFPPTGRAFASGLFAASMALGSAVAPVLAAWLLLRYDWQQLLRIYMLPGLLWVAVFALVVPDRRDAAPQTGSLAATIGRMATSFPMQLLCLQQFLRAAAMVFFFTWFPRFLQETWQVSQFESGQLAWWPGVGAMFGGISGGIVSDWLLKVTGRRRISRQGVAVAGTLLCAGLALSAAYAADVVVAVLFLSAAAFWGFFAGVSGYSVCLDVGGRRVGTVISVMNTCGNVGGGVFPIVIGALVSRTGNWDFVLPLFAGMFVADAVCWALMNPKRPLFEDDEYPETRS
jgi:MFS transporter, ACS family, aldohexuronate transporter